MPDNALRFTNRARRTMSIAQEAAEQFNHTHISLEHLLLGMAREEGCVAAVVLGQLGITIEEIERFVAEGHPHQPPSTKLGLTPSVKAALQQAVNEARALNHTYIGTEHMLLGLITVGEDPVHVFFAAQDVTPEQIRKKTHHTLSAK